ncbi:14124_t:CDS:2 [Cetraspora pellucida]|uniref:14124_t:CDS:1 n=1 Tax=Cetraspora pellucida TaxID=1433469 RepID=A0ACA9L9L7_9GLOM|nr:14124_t:CDS:2 [Cetraspora pellucida]
MSGNENNNYLTTRRAFNETKKAYIKKISENNIINFIHWTEIDEKIEFVDVGGSRAITKAKWITKNIVVALKAVAIYEETNSENDEFIKEHTKNVVIQKDDNVIRAIITDFGLSKVLPRNSKSNQKLAGCMPFVDPKILKDSNETPDKSSDIYSLGVVLWEITSNGRPPFDNCNIVSISLQIMNGKRETPINGTTNSYIAVYTNCWDENPKSRPEIERVKELIHQEEIISGEKCISDTDIGQIPFRKKISNKVNNEQISKKLLEMFELLSIKDLEMFEKLSAKDPDEMGHLVQAAAAHKKKIVNSEENEQ